MNDFHCQFYIQTVDNDDIKVVHAFRRITDLGLETQDMEVIQKALEDKYLGKMSTFEWNKRIGDEEELQMVQITAISTEIKE